MTEKVFGTEKKGSLRDIPLPNEQGSSNTLDLQNDSHDNFDNWSNMKRKNKRSSSKIIGFLVLVLLFIGLYSVFFHSASVVVSANSQQVTVTQQEFTASVSASDSDNLEFTRVDSYDATESLYVEGSTEENKQTKTSGAITVYNTDSTVKSYIKNTRFQTEDGLVYRAFKRFVIPAGTADNPGSVEVTIGAENPGEKYNSESGATFTLPALKEQNDPSFDKVYARQTEPLTGGFSGVIRVPSETDIAEAKVKLEIQIEQNLEKDFAESLPDNYIINKDYLRISEVEFSEKPNSEKGGIDLVAQATLDSVVFKKESFEKFMATQLLDDYNQGDPIVIDNINQLTMEIDESFDPRTVESFNFTVAGNVQFKTPIDEAEIKRLISGNLKSHITNGLVNGLETVIIEDVSVSPFWRRTTPSDADSISVIVNE